MFTQCSKLNHNSFKIYFFLPVLFLHINFNYTEVQNILFAQISLQGA